MESSANNHPIEHIKRIEEQYNVKEIICNDLRVWDFLRHAVFFEIEKNYYDFEYKQCQKNYFNALYNKIFKNKSNNKNKFILFTDIKEQRVIDNHIIDKLGYNIVKTLMPNCLTIINPMNSKINGNYYNNVMSMQRLSSGIIKNNIINNVSTLDNIKRNEIDVPFIYLINKFFSIYNRAIKYFQKNDVKAIFVNCFYSIMHQAVIYAAKKSNIKVLEIQHGVISKNQYYYNPTYQSIDLLLPDYLLAYNQYVSSHINSYYMEPSKVLPFGNFYLNYKIEGSKKILNRNFKNQYEKIILISHQDSVEEKLLNIINKLAINNKNVCFVVSIRHNKTQKKILESKENLVFLNSEDIYDMILVCDLHISIYSTFILETLYAGIPNILLNISKLSENYFSKILIPSNNIRYANNIDDVITLINDWPFNKKDDIKEQYSYLFKDNQIEQMQTILDIIQ